MLRIKPEPIYHHRDEALFEVSCDSNWNVVLQKIDRDLVIKHLKVMFETEFDRDKFLDKYLGVGQ